MNYAIHSTENALEINSDILPITQDLERDLFFISESMAWNLFET